MKEVYDKPQMTVIALHTSYCLLLPASCSDTTDEALGREDPYDYEEYQDAISSRRLNRQNVWDDMEEEENL